MGVKAGGSGAESSLKIFSSPLGFVQPLKSLSYFLTIKIFNFF